MAAIGHALQGLDEHGIITMDPFAHRDAVNALESSGKAFKWEQRGVSWFRRDESEARWLFVMDGRVGVQVSRHARNPAR